MDAEALAATVRSICAIDVDDAMRFDAAAISVQEIREEANYGGLRVRLLGTLGNAKCSLQLDVGYGDVVTPGPSEVELRTLLEGMPAPRLRIYPRETVVAEKLEAIASLGMANSRMKDDFDLRALLREGALETKPTSTRFRPTHADGVKGDLRSCAATGLDDLKSKRPKVSAVGQRASETYGHFCCIVKCAAPPWATDGPHLGHRWATKQKSRFVSGSLQCNYLI